MKHPLYILLAALFFFSGCVSLNSLSLTSIPKNREKQVRIEKEKFIFLGFNFDNDFINTASEDLRRQCPNGKVTGLLTKDENINYFLYIFWKKRITATGFCVPMGDLAKGEKNRRGTASASEEPSEESELQ